MTPNDFIGLDVSSQAPDWAESGFRLTAEGTALALGRLARYAGNTKVFYSVAEHCVLLARHIAQLPLDALPGPRLVVMREALAHDAAETITSDLPWPTIRLIGQLTLQVATGHLEGRMRKVLEMPEEPDPRVAAFVHQLDKQIAHNEIRSPVLFPPFEEAFLDRAFGRPDWSLTGVVVQGWSPDQAAQEWLAQWTWCSGLLLAVPREAR